MFDETTMIPLRIVGLMVTVMAVTGLGVWMFWGPFEQYYSVRTRVVLVLLEGVVIVALAFFLLFKVLPK